MKMLIRRFSAAESGEFDFVEVGQYGTCWVVGTDIYSGEETEYIQLSTLAQQGYFTLEIRGYRPVAMYWHGFHGQELILSMKQSVLDGLFIDCVEQSKDEDIPLEYPQNFEKMYVFSRKTRRIMRAVIAESEQLVLRKRGDEMWLVSVGGFREIAWEPLNPMQLWKLIVAQKGGENNVVL